MLEQFLTIELLYAALIAYAGGTIRGYSGFGSGMIMAPLMTLMWGPVEAIAVIIGAGVIGSAPQTVANVKLINFREMAPMLIAALIFVPIGGVMLVNFDPVIIKRVIAISILIAALVQISGWSYKGPRGAIPSGIAGAVSGWVNGISSVGGPAAVMYLISLPDEPRVQRANITITIYTHGSLLFLTLLISGALGLTSVIWSGLVLGPYFLGMWSGGRLFHVLPDRIFRWVVLGILVVLSVLILVA